MFRNNLKSLAQFSLAAALCIAPAALYAQGHDTSGPDGGPGPGFGQGAGQDWHDHGPDRGPDERRPMERFHEAGPHFWSNPRIAAAIGLTDDQKKKMDAIAQEHRLKLIDLNANLEKQEAIMHPLIEADQQDETKILAQIDAVAQARAELEKDRARMLFSLRQVLTPDQWKKLKTVAHEGPGGFGRPGGPGGPDGKQWRRGPNGGPDGQGKGANGQPPAPSGDQPGGPQ
ncbi:Spy/CpxP family protein refolding chaperone [Silvibacterium sp.]|uniref:Spy/CpxP family protein refolding chaperone n=1 Tax=Silvibacterium sp. TaxID=1964179 RepID=UPI0039E43BEB